ncbi:trypsin-like peptidase domain-containing protein [Streptomyces solaniscabiei]|uniref:trypsin-like peptidase domain-containing protein n=1 Tax=Streptomyces solaniscabiei TaxID=2683255 RepID=UPI001CE25BFE|nr:trypsin-like peptidase domain-containing protein [Streptomyces solaniscabiei]
MASRNRSREADGSARRLPRNDLPGTQDDALPSPDDADGALVRIQDLAGRPRGTGFAADHHGTVITSHEAVDGLTRLVLLTAGDRRLVVAAADVTPLPGLGLALVRAEGLGTGPLPVTVRDRVEAGTYVRIAAGCWREARVLGTTDVTYTATDRFHHVGDALELAVGTSGRDALRLGGGAAGGPVLDVTTGAVLGVLGTALASGHRDVGFAVPLRASSGPLADLLAKNAETVAAYGADLNLAGILELTATSMRGDGPCGAGPVPPVDLAGSDPSDPAAPVGRDVPAREFAAFAARTGGPAHVLGLVGAPGTGRTTELAALAARRSRGPEPAPTLWLRGADLCDDDTSVADAARRTLARAARVVAASDRPRPAGLGDITPERLARLAGSAGRPLLILLDGPEEMPPVLAHRLAEWTEGTTAWLRQTGARLVVACRAEYWERAGAEFPREVLHGAAAGEPAAVCGPGERLWGPMPSWAAEAGELSGVAARGLRSGDGAAGPAPRRVPGGEGAAGAGAGHSRPLGAEGGAGAFDSSGAFSSDLVTEAGAPPDPASAAVPAGPAASFSGLGPDAPPPAQTASPTLPSLRSPGSVRTPPAPGACGTASAPPASSRNPTTSRPCPGGGAVGIVGGSSGSGVEVGVGGWGRAGEVRPGDGPEAGTWGSAGPGDGPSRLGPETAVGGPGRSGAVPVGPRPAMGAARPAAGAVGCGALPPCVRLGDLRDEEAREARARYRIAEGILSDGDGRHPLTLRLLSEVQAALPGAALPPVRIDRDAVFGACLDLMCLRVAARLAAENGLRGTAVRRLAARVSGQVHEAARRSLSPGQGELDRESFGELFPWGPAPARLGGGTGWAYAVLAEGLLVTAGSGYRFAHEELADWIQGTHLDLDEALRVLVHDRHAPQDTHTVPVPRHRIGPVVEALLHLGRQHGVPQLALTLEELVHALDAEPHSWWAGRLLAGTLTRLPDATPYTEVLRLLADGIAERRGGGRPVPAEFGPAFWTDLRLPEATRLDLLRRLLLADGAPHEPGPRHLDTVARLLAADPATVQPLLVRWFDDERPLPATPHATVATAAQALLHTHRHRGLDGLTEVLADSTHRRADELLAVLAEEEPSAVCRAVDRWARDERPARHTAAVTHGLRAAPHVRTAADRTLLRHAALVLLTRPADGLLHGGALALLVQDPGSRDRHLPRALDHFAAGDPYLPPSAVAAALPTHPDPVLDAFRARLRGPDAGEALRRLLDATTPPLACRVAVLIGEAVAERPETAGHVAAYTDRRLDQGPAARGVLLPLVTGLLDGGPEPVRAALAGVLAGDGAPASGSLRRELRDHLLAHEDDPAVLDALLRAAAQGGDSRRALVHRTALLLVRTPDGTTRLDRGLVDLARHLPGFAGRVTGWLADAPDEWAALVGPSARRTIESLAGTRVPA